MPDQPQSIPVNLFAIAPVQLKPVADMLLVVPARSSTIQYILGKLIPGTPAIPEVPGIVGRGKILDDKGNVVSPAIEGKPATPKVAAVPDDINQIDSGSIEMSDDEWNGWKDQDDAAYRATIVAARLGLTLN